MSDRFESEPYLDPIRRARYLREFTAEPFFTTEPPCVDCGHPLSKCACNEAPDEPVCPNLYPQIVAARNVREIRLICQAHRLVCPACGGFRKMPERETTPAMPARKAA
jgi:hypothetical protein